MYVPVDVTSVPSIPVPSQKTSKVLEAGMLKCVLQFEATPEERLDGALASMRSTPSLYTHFYKLKVSQETPGF